MTLVQKPVFCMSTRFLMTRERSSYVASLQREYRQLFRRSGSLEMFSYITDASSGLQMSVRSTWHSLLVDARQILRHDHNHCFILSTLALLSIACCRKFTDHDLPHEFQKLFSLELELLWSGHW